MNLKHLAAASAALAALVAGGTAAFADGSPHAVRYSFTGDLRSAGSGSVSIAVETGSRAALRKLVGSSQDQAFAIGDSTEVLRWAGGVPTVVHASDLAAGDVVTVHVLAGRDASLAQIEATPAGVVDDRGANPTRPSQPLWVFRGTLSAAAVSSSLSIHVASGNWRALRAMLGQSLDQTFAVDAATIFLRWQGKVPTVISESQLAAGEKITIRVRAPRAAGLGAVERTSAVHVGDREPAAPGE